MGISQSINRINFEKTQNIIKQQSNINFIIINTLKHNNQTCLIKNTIHAENEETTINYYLKHNKNINILIYGENCCDKKLIEKVNQLKQLGFNNLYIYIGGLFEWLLLQDIYGEEEFPTTEKCLDILKYKG